MSDNSSFLKSPIPDGSPAPSQLNIAINHKFKPYSTFDLERRSTYWQSSQWLTRWQHLQGEENRGAKCHFAEVEIKNIEREKAQRVYLTFFMDTSETKAKNKDTNTNYISNIIKDIDWFT